MIPGSLGHATIRKTRGLHWHNSHSNNIEESMWFDGSSQYLTRTPSAGNRTRWTLAWWFKLNAVSTDMTFFSANSGSNDFYIRMDPDILKVVDDNASLNLYTPKLRDIGWYHAIVSYDSNNASPYERLHIYINGERQVLTEGSAGTPSSAGETFWNNAQANEIGRRSRTTSSYTNAYMAQIVFLNADSIQNGDCAVSDFLDTWAFGNNGTQFVPKKTSDLTTLASNAGGNSFCLDFADSSALGNDVSSNNNDFSDAGSPGAANQTSNTPSREYATFNALVKSQNSYTLTNGNTKANLASGGGFIPLTQLVQGNEKVYVEFVADDANNGNWSIGVADPSVDQDAAVRQSGIIAWESDGDKYVDASQTATDVRAWTDGAVMALALDMENRKLWIRDSSGWQGSGGSDDPTDSSTGVALPSSIGNEAVIIFGNSAGSFDQDCELKTEANSALTYAIPSGFKTLSSKDGTEPEYQGIDYFDSTLYEGNGSGQRVGDFVPFTDVGTITKSFLADGRTNSGTTDLTIAHTVSTSPTNVQVKTLSFWIKPVDVDQQYLLSGSPTATDSTDSSERIFVSSTGQVLYNTRNSGSAVVYAITDGNVINDTSQWVNVVVALNYASGVSSASDRLKIYINGVLQGLSDGGSGYDTAPAENMTGQAYLNAASTRQLIGTHPGFTSAANRANAYLAEWYMVDGQALAPSVFGVTDTSTNRWVPRAPATIKSTINGVGSGFGNCGYYLDFLDASALGDDDSGNNRDFTESGTIGTANQSNDTPSNNLAVLDGKDTIGSATPSLSKGNLTYTGVDNAGAYVSGFPLTSGKWYWEIDVATTSTAFYPGFFTPAGVAFASTTPWNNNSGSFLIAPGAGHWLGHDGDGTANLTSNFSAFLSNGDRMFFAYDADNKYAYVGEVGSGGSGSTFTYYGRGGTVSGDPTSGEAGTGAAPFGLPLIGEDTFYFGIVSGGTTTVANLIFDPTKFNGTPPTGYKALTQDNKDDADDKITAWAWIKNRDDASTSHVVVDRVRGVTKVMHPDGTGAEAAGGNSVQRFLQRGVQIGNGSLENAVNKSHVLWQWLIGTSASTGSTTSPAGTIASTSIVADADHFSIVTYTGNQTSGATFGHGLSGAPEMVIVKERDPGGNNWMVGHDAMGWGKYLAWDTNASVVTSSARWNDTDPSSTVVTLGNDTGINATGATYVAYCFRSVPGVCGVGSYEGNNNADGTFVNLGFKPAWVMTKTMDASGAWGIYDSKRDPDNPVQQRLFAEGDGAEDTDGEQMDFLSNGFKLRKTGGHNNNNETYIYLAMAELGPNGAYPPIYGR